MSQIALVDCNNFFVSCERLFRPDLYDKPVAVLSNNDGCIVARSNRVKALGIPMGVPLFQVRAIVERHGIKLFSANFELYGDISQRIVKLLRQAAPLVEVYSIDECFLDLSRLPIHDKGRWADELRQRILREIGVPVSIGVAPTKTLAKAANYTAKQSASGVSVVDNHTKRQQVLSHLPVPEIWGIGRRLGVRLQDKGVTNAFSVANASDKWLADQFHLTRLQMVDELRGQARYAFGDRRDKRQSIRRSRSFGHRVRDYHQLESATASFTAAAAQRLRAQASVCGAVLTSLVVRYGGSQRRIEQIVNLDEPTADTGRLINAALGGLLEVYDSDFAYQKASVTLLDISDNTAWQLSLTAPDKQRDRRSYLMTEVDRLNRRFGPGSVSYATENRLGSNWQSKKDLRSQRYTTRLDELPTLKR